MSELYELVTAEGRFEAEAVGEVGAPCVVLLHGFPQSSYTWRDLLPALAASGYRAIAPNQRGYSPGVRPTEVDGYATPRLVQDVLDMFDVLGAQRVHLIGHDWGGQVAWLTAAHHPDRVASLSVLSRPHPAAFARAFELDADQSQRSGHHRRFQSPDLTDELWRDECAALRSALSRGGVSDDDVTAYLDVFADRAAVDAALNWYRAAGALTQPSCPDVSVPTLYLWGDEDFSVGRVAAELTAQYVTGPYRFVEVTGSGHFLTDDGGAQSVIGEVLAHLARVE